MILVASLVLGLLAQLAASHLPPRLDRGYWERLGHDDLMESLEVRLNTRVAKNVILFIGDGMGPNTVTAARIYKGGETSYLSWERFPHYGALKTYSANMQVPDSGATATAMFTGTKVNHRVLGMDTTVEEKDVDKCVNEKAKLTTLAKLAQAAGKATGFVTTTRVTHATPGALFASSPSRTWECETEIPLHLRNKCKDIGRQLIEDEPGKSLNVIMGGGRQSLMTNVVATDSDPIERRWGCVREDGLDLIKEWSRQKKERRLNYAFVGNTNSLLNLDTRKVDYLMGIFGNHHLPFEYMRKASEVPSLSEMTTTAIKVLMKNKNGFFLMVEGGLIDQAHHRGRARKALEEVLAFNNAINDTMKLLESSGILDDTLVIVTSDHSHTLTISGYPSRGNNILGLAMKSKADGVPYTTLQYANSGKDNYHYVVNGSKVTREDPSKVDTTSYEYGIQAGVLNDENTHGGSDVFISATGPHAHLFHRIHEQSYVATVIKYAARLGEYKNHHYDNLPSSSFSLHLIPLLALVSSLLIHCLNHAI